MAQLIPLLIEHEKNVAAWGFILSVLGTILTVVGFGLTFLQLAKTRSATAAATQAIDNLKSRIAAFDVVTELSRAVASLSETRRHIKNVSWSDALDSYLEAQLAVSKLSALPSDLSGANKARLLEISDEIGRACSRIRTSLAKGTRGLDQAKALHSLSNYIVEINGMSLQVERAI
jgi:hypothetical protein